MLGLLLFSVVGAAAIGEIFNWFDLFGDDNEDFSEAEIEKGFSLLDPTYEEGLTQALETNPEAFGRVDDADESLLVEFDVAGVSDEFGSVDSELTNKDDLAAIPTGAEEQSVLFGLEGDDVLVGNDFDNVLFGDEGDDVIFGQGGLDQLFGNEGSDTIVGGSGADLIVDRAGGGAFYGGEGDDNIIIENDQAAEGDPPVLAAISGGKGADGIILSTGYGLIAGGEGADHIQVDAPEEGETTSAIVTDFDPAEDALLIEVVAENAGLAEEQGGIPLEFRATQIETDRGPATLVEPAVDDAAALGDLGAYIAGYAVLLGVSPEDLEGAAIQVVLTSADAPSTGPGGTSAVAKEMGATRI